jgi:hypothetical protein
MISPDWTPVLARLDQDGYAVTDDPLLTPAECRDLREQFGDDERFRSTVDMARYRFGEGSYRYYAYPLPDVVGTIREDAYPPLAELANTWSGRLSDHDRNRDRNRRRYPEQLAEFLEACRQAGQCRPTPLILRYQTGGYNTLHQDLYGEVAFPFQLTIGLSQPGVDFTGGENLLIEQRPRAQSRGTAITLPPGHALVFPNRYRPVRAGSGWSRTVIRHGVSTVTSGMRYALGVIFHDAA